MLTGPAQDLSFVSEHVIQPEPPSPSEDTKRVSYIGPVSNILYVGDISCIVHIEGLYTIYRTHHIYAHVYTSMNQLMSKIGSYTHMIIRIHKFTQLHNYSFTQLRKFTQIYAITHYAIICIHANLRNYAFTHLHIYAITHLRKFISFSFATETLL